MKTNTNYPLLLAAAALLIGSACNGADIPPEKTAAKPAATAAAAPAAAATPAATSPASHRYQQAAGSGSLDFSFEQAGAENHGSFRKFSTELNYDPGNLAASSLKVTVQIASLDTQDKDRDDTLLGDDLFAVKQNPTAQFVAGSLAKGANGSLEAAGKLTLRGVTRDLRLPITIRPTPNGVELSGAATIKRLEFGVGQGEWQSTEWVGDEVKLQYKVPLARAR